MTRSERAAELARRLPELYPDAHCELNFTTPLDLLVATILSAQCTDRSVNLATPALFARCRTAADYAALSPAELEDLLRRINFYRSKAAAIHRTAHLLLERHAGEVPRSLTELVALPGVGRKTANVVLGNAFGIASGVVVDTHVGRLSRRLGLTRHLDPVKIEAVLGRLFPRPLWTVLSHWLISHGRRRCDARRPDCPNCELADLCPRMGVAVRPESRPRPT